MDIFETVNVVSPGAYVVADVAGDIGTSEGQGLFYKDTRHLSKFVLRIDGAALTSVGRNQEGSKVEFYSHVAGSDRLCMERRRTIGAGMEEEILIRNGTEQRVEAHVDLEFDADFEDIFTVRGYRRSSEKGKLCREVKDGVLTFAYQREDFRRVTKIRVSGARIESIGEPGIVSTGLRLGAGEIRTLRVSVSLEVGGAEVLPPPKDAGLYTEPPLLETEWTELREAWRQSLEDLGMLTFDVEDGLLVPAAGAPWYMALFGRDALITAYQTMLLGVEPAKNTLRALARYQARDYDDYRDAEPGKILHEIRHGELAHFGEIPHSPYYGTIDATPLFLVLLGEVWNWTADTEFAREMEQPARRALAWVRGQINSDERSYLAYETRSKAGLWNHGWKDSDDAILFRNGERAEPPIALCEVQGYAYDAFLRMSELSELAWDNETLAGRLRAEAAELKARFDRDFWMEERNYYALALDGYGNQVDSITSNAGHLLWSGIVPEERANLLAERLMGEDLFCGWGLRTMAAGERGYDPDSYHNGSIWPHDNALVAVGLRRYGFKHEANRIATALIEAAPYFGYRLPEVFAGYQRVKDSGPIEVPRSCSPQAWAAGTVPLLVRTMMGLEPDPKTQSLAINTNLEEYILGMRLRGVAAFQNKHEVEG